MSACQSCGAALDDATRFCRSCGSATGLGTNVPIASGENSSVVGALPSPAESGSRALDTNVVGALTYLAGFVTGIAFLVLDPYKSNSFVRFHAFQSIFFNVACVGFWTIWMVLSAVLTPLTAGIFRLIALLMLVLTLGGFGIWIFLMCQAYRQKLFKLPIVGNFAAGHAGVRL